MLLKTKLHLPKQAIKPVKRPEIVKCFSQEHRLTLLAAPAGYGKTNIVLEWLASLSALTGWVSLDEADNDINQFIQYLLAGCENAAPELVKLRNQVSDVSSVLSIEPILTALINIFVDRSQAYILVLDDYHHIHNPDIHEALIFLLENKPSDFHIVISSRSELPFPIGRWRAKNEVTELRAADLRLSQGEIAAFCTAQAISDLSKADIQALAERTEGWIAALQLAIIAMQGLEDRSAFISNFTGSHTYVVDYLTDEVMRQQPADRQHFLMQTSLLPRLNANLCDDILEIADSQDILADFETQNLFLISLDDRREWYRYHHLFQEMLHYRLQREALEQIVPLHRRASRWFMQQGWIEEGIAQAAKAEDWSAITQIIVQNITATFSQGKMSTVRRWFSHLPHEIILADVELCINYAWALNLSGGGFRRNDTLSQTSRETPATNPSVGGASGSNFCLARISSPPSK